MKLLRLYDTKNMEKEKWLACRKTRIGGSDAGAICGLNPYRSAVDVWLNKTGRAEDKMDNEAMRQGRDLEEYVARRFEEATGKKVYKVNAILANVHGKYPFALANVDRLVAGENAGLECKTGSAFAAKKWKDGKIPEEYEIQCHHYMMVTGADAWYIAVCILGKEFIWHKIDRDEEIIKYLAEIEKDFWSKYVLADEMPPADGSNAYDEYLAGRFPEAVAEESVDISEYTELLDRREEITELKKKLETQIRQIDQQVKEVMQTAALGYSEQYNVKWNVVKTTRLDIEKLKKEYPEVYAACAKENQHRRFAVTKM